MKRAGGLVFGLAVILCVATGCTSEGEPLAPDSPGAAAELFVDAFSDDDFAAVWMLLDPEARFRFEQLWNLLEYDRLIRPDEIPDFAGRLLEIQQTPGLELGDTSQLFNLLMLEADRHDAFLIDLNSGVELGQVAREGDRAVVAASIDGIDGNVMIALTQVSEDQWQVHQVLVPGGDVEQIPWSVPNSSD